MKKTASNPINYIAGALWAYFVIEEVIGLIRFPGGLNMGVIVEIIGMILIAAALFTKTKYPLAAVGYSMLTVLSLANLIRQFVYIFDGASPGIYLVNSLLRIVGCAFAAAIIAAQLLSREQWGRTLKGLWFIPVIMFAISTLILLITTLINFGFDMSIRYYIDRILSIAADVLTLLWYAIGIDGSGQNAYNTGNPRIGYGPNGARPYPQGGGQYPRGGQYPQGGGQYPQGGSQYPQVSSHREAASTLAEVSILRGAASILAAVSSRRGAASILATASIHREEVSIHRPAASIRP